MIKFCTQCGSKVEYKIPIHDARVRAVCVECQYVHYENPNIIAGVLPVYKDEILLCKRSIEPKKGMWTIPSGFLELNETVEEGALREAKEEAGIDPQISHLYCMYNLPHIGQVYLLYLARLKQRKAACGDETSEIGFFRFDQIPWKEIAFSSVTFVLENYIDDFSTQKFPLRSASL